MTKIKLLSTRKLSEDNKAVLSVDRFDLIEEDFISIKFIDFTLPEKTDLLLFTSQNAVLSVLKNPLTYSLKDTSVICVGEKTKELLEQNGFEVLDFTHYAEDLTKIIAAKYSDKSFAFFCGNLRRNILPDFFIKQNIPFTEIRIYQNVLSPKKIDKPFDAVMFFSPSGVMSFLDNNSLKNQVCFCIGTTTAEALLPYENKIILSEKPTLESLIKKVKEHFRYSE